MKNVELREWKDLTKKERQEAFNQEVNALVELEIYFLDQDLQKGQITEDEYFDSLGCSANYAETTGWFVPSCYYEKHKKDIDTQAQDNLETAVFDKDGQALWRV